MADLLKKKEDAFRAFKRGDHVRATISQITPKKIYFDLGGKTEGVIFGEELKRAHDYLATLGEGDKVEVVVGSPEDARGQILVSLRDQVQRHAWKFLRKQDKGEALRWWGMTLLPRVFWWKRPFL